MTKRQKLKNSNLLVAFSLIVFHLINTTVLAADSDELPIAPMNPQAREDCNNLRSKYSLKIAQKFQEQHRCIQSEPTIGLGRQCNGGYGKQAWPECGDIEFSRCELERNKDKAFQLCIDAVNAKRNQEKKTKDNLWDRGKKLFDMAYEANNALRDPEEYLKDLAHEKLHEILIGNEEQGISKDETIAHIYNYGYNFATKGIEFTRDPVIKDFQKHMLEKIGHVHKTLLLKIDHIDSEMGSFVEDLRAAGLDSSFTHSSFEPTSVVAPPVGSGGDSHQDCYLKKSSCEQSCGNSACIEACNDEWYRCRYE
jgi:hypothetical protein